jgi:hypothetical protein
MFKTIIALVFGDVETAVNSLWFIVVVSILIAWLWYIWQYKPTHNKTEEILQELRDGQTEIKGRLSRIDAMLVAIGMKIGVDSTKMPHTSRPRHK